MTESPLVVDVLWTGGWDSTFRVLDILHRSNAVVEPWYVVDPIRPSAELELRTTERIRQLLAARRPELAARLRPMMIRRRAAVPEDPAVSALWAELRARGRIGAQYDWLSRLMRAEGRSRVELSIHDPTSFFGQLLVAHSVRRDTSYGPVLELKPETAPDGAELFRPFAFSLMGMGKRDMQRAAEQGGFADLLEHTWFCAEPRRGTACGLCHPCQQAIQQGMAWRMPLTSRVLGHAHARVLRARRAWKRRRRGG